MGKKGRWSTGPLLVGGFVVMMALMTILYLGAVRLSDELAKFTNDIYSHPLAVSNAVRDANYNILAMHSEMKDIALSRNADEREAAITRVARHDTTVLDNFKIIASRFLGNESMVNKARKSFIDWRHIRSEVIELSRNGRYDEAVAIINDRGNKHIVQTSLLMNDLIDFANRKASRFLSASKDKQTWNRIFLRSMFFVVLLTAVAIAIFVVVRVRHIEKLILAAMAEAERANKAKSEFLSSMSHDLRTPLNAIIGFSDMMLHETHGPISNRLYHEYTRDINNSGLHLVHMVNDILDLSKIEAGCYETENAWLDIGQTLSATMRMIAPQIRAKGLTINVDVPSDLPDLWCDQRVIVQILTNLLDNAVKYTENGGAIKMRANKGDDGTILISISDTGIGMSKKELAEMSDPFYRGNSYIARKEEGTGLCLHLCKKLALLLDATVGIDSGENGTTVTVTFPKKLSAEYPAKPRSGKHIQPLLM